MPKLSQMQIWSQRASLCYCCFLLNAVQPLSSHVYAENSKKRELLISAWRGREWGRGILKRRPEKEGGRPVLSVFLCLKYLMSAPALLKYWLFSHIAGGDRRERRLFPRSNEKQKAVSIKLSSPSCLFIYFLFSFSISAIKGKHDPRPLRSGGGRHWGVKGTVRSGGGGVRCWVQSVCVT